jgi:two-component system, NtrC family, sensor kinase
MKQFFLIIFLVLPQTFNCFSQGQTVNGFYVNSLPPEGVMLNNGWKFHAGDDPGFASPEYDDTEWEPIDPTVNVLELPPVTRSDIGWIRLRITKGSDLTNQPLALLISQNIASEIYLNGQLTYKFGTISKDIDKIVAYNPAANSPNRGKPFAVPVEDKSDLLIAVRFAVQPNINYEIGGNLSPLMLIRLNSVNEAFDQVWKNERHFPINNTFRVGAYLILAFLHLAFFIYNPSQKAYLFFFLFAICYVPADILQFNLPSEVEALYTTTLLYYAFWEISGLFLMTALYRLLGQKLGWIYWILVLATIAGFFLNNWVYSTFVIQNLVSLELVRTSLKALKLKTRGAWILATGAISFLIFQGAFIVGFYFKLSYWFIPISEIHLLADLLYVIAALSIPVATTIYIALDFAFTGHALQEKLVEVEKLSERTIEQEKEKREILSSVNETLEKQVSKRTQELRESLENLKATQAQLVQSEKMASLGELTAGIAHEIQNPLNFVNNFSEVSNELIKEIQDIRHKTQDQSIKSEEDEILNDIASNLEKINHHGKRAADIVKGMLQHSRSSSGVKELTDINALADEYLRLAYHGLRAKDKSFNAKFETHLDPTLPKVNIVPQDIGRVVLNLINNAIYAVNDRKKLLAASNEPLANYEPTVSVSTKKEGNKVLISVKDNGNGIHPKILGKIFQPFFTTKPTGQGTGLGLSLSYDIVKAHGGELKVETLSADLSDHNVVKAEAAAQAGNEGEGSRFIIQLPIV